MAPLPLAADTSPAIEERQLDAWRRMSATEKAALVTGLTQAVFELGLAGVRQRHPDASPREQFLRLALINLGPDLATRAFPEISHLNLR